MQGNADISTGFPIQAREELDGLQFAEERLSVVMPAAHRLAGRTRVALGELLAERILLLDMDESRDVKQTAVYRLLIRHGIDPSHILFSQSPSTVGLTICKTGAVSILMHSMGNLRRDYLVAVPLSDEDCALPLFLYRRKDDPNEAVTAFFSAVP